MSVKFYTKSQQMTVVNAQSGDVVDAWHLADETTYDFFFVVENEDPKLHKVELLVTHGPFGIGWPAGSSGISAPNIQVDVPPKGPGGNGLATCMFQFTCPDGSSQGGHGCLVVSMTKCDGLAINGPTLNQNMTFSPPIPINIQSTLSFLVYGLASDTVILTLTEKLENGSAVNHTHSWSPTLSDPSGTIGPINQTPSPLTLNNLDRTAYYSIALQVEPKSTTAHVFHIVGTDLMNKNLGEVELRVEGTQSATKPDPYITGSCQSPDIILYDTMGRVPLGGLPGGPWDTLLEPDTDYVISAIIHNASNAPAVNTVVRFWNFPGGLAYNGILIDVQTTTVPALGWVEVKASNPFRSAKSGEHSCAVVSIYNALAGSCIDASDPTQVPDPNANINHSCSAWRNTDSMLVVPSIDWNLNLQLDHPTFGPGPIEIEVDSHHIPIDWFNHEKVIEIDNILKSGGVSNRIPLYLMPTLKDSLKPIDLKISAKSKLHNKIEPVAANKFRVQLKKAKPTPLVFSGVVPAETNDGDIILVKVTAHYGNPKDVTTKSIDFLQVLHVASKKGGAK